MQYMLLIYENESVYGDKTAGSAAIMEVVGKHMALSQSLGAARIAGAGLKNTNAATTLRTSGGKQALHDGPFAETKEQLGGYYLIDVPDLDAAIAVARKIPLYAEGAIEIRPVLNPDERKAQ